MSFVKALIYFLREALINLFRGWKVSLVAVSTIAVSLLVGGVFLLLSANLSELIARWRTEARVIVYLDDGAEAAEREALDGLIRGAPWVTAVETVSAEAAAERFGELFPSLSELVAGLEEEPLPTSLEVRYRAAAVEPGPFEAWIDSLEASPAAAMVDDDRDWLTQLEAVVRLIRLLGLGLAGVLLVAAVFTIASVIRLTAYLYQDEIAIMRLVGATEFFIRGPFYAEGLLQGLAGGLVALAGLYASFLLVRTRATPTLLGDLLTGQFLGWREMALMVLLGALAGLVGAVASLHREKLQATES